MTPPQRILLLHFGQLGDAVLALPAARALRQHFPQAELTVLAARGPHAVFQMAGFSPLLAADRVRWRRHPLAAALEIPRLLIQLRRRRFDLSVDLHSYKETNWLAFLAGIPERVAMLRPTRSVPSLINRKPPPDDPHAPLLDRYCQVLAPLGIEVADRVPYLDPPPARLPDLPPGPILGICPGAGHPSRRWPADRFAQLIAGFAPAAQILVFAGPEETAAQLGPLESLSRVQIWRGLSLPELAAALQLCRVVVSNPTGPAHLAAAVGARVLVLGEIPAFDPVPRPPGQVKILRAPARLADIPLAAVTPALARLWAD